MVTTTKWAVALSALALTAGAQLHGEPLPQTCAAPGTQGSSLTIRIQLTPEAFSKVVFDHPKPEGTVPAGVIGQSMICTCVDAAGNINDGVKLLRGSGSPQLDTEAVEIGKNLVYPAGNPGCMHDTVNFAAP
ncbi:MAG TPA: hypothetical protein VNO35_00945 [Steroidobacteraceae bacterium]|nr:hypothetical protein [Steroidobacteraceae bacterium]